MREEELINVVGGGWFSATLMNAAARVVNTALELGRSLGTSIRMAISGKICR